MNFSSLKCDASGIGQLTSNWEYTDGILFYKKRIYLSAEMDLIPIILQEFHNGTREGVLKTI